MRSKERYEHLMREARATNAKRDAFERKIGWASPGDGSAGVLDLFLLLRTAMEAIRAGIVINDWSCVAEGQALLEQLHARIEAHHDLTTVRRPMREGILRKNGSEAQ